MKNNLKNCLPSLQVKFFFYSALLTKVENYLLDANKDKAELSTCKT